MRFTFHSHCAPGNEKPGHDPTSGRPLRAPAWLLRRCPRRRARCRACGATAAVPRCHRHANAREEEHETATKAAAWAAVWVAAAAVVLARVLGLSSGGAGGSSCALRNPQVGDLRAPLVPPGGSAAGRVQCEARWALRRRGRQRAQVKVGGTLRLCRALRLSACSQQRLVRGRAFDRPSSSFLPPHFSNFLFLPALAL